MSPLLLPTCRQIWSESYTFAELKDTKFIGYDDQFTVAASFILDVLEKKSELLQKSLLIFGVPGNGKTFFPKALVPRLKEKSDLSFNLLRIICDYVPMHIPASVTIAELMDCINESLRFEPILVYFDEVDLLCPHMDQVSPKQSPYSAWMRRLLRDDRLRTKDIVLMGVTNNPTSIDLSVKRNFGTLVYFEPTPFEVIKEIIKAELDGYVKKPDEIADKYISGYQSLKMRPMGAEVTTACRILKASHPNLNSMSLNQIVSILKGKTPVPPTDVEIQASEKRYKDLKNLCEQNYMPHWLNVSRT